MCWSFPIMLRQTAGHSVHESLRENKKCYVTSLPQHGKSADSNWQAYPALLSCEIQFSNLWGSFDVDGNTLKFLFCEFSSQYFFITGMLVTHTDRSTVVFSQLESRFRGESGATTELIVVSVSRSSCTTIRNLPLNNEYGDFNSYSICRDSNHSNCLPVASSRGFWSVIITDTFLAWWFPLWSLRWRSFWDSSLDNDSRYSIFHVCLLTPS